jgi:hypothetical protein
MLLTTLEESLGISFALNEVREARNVGEFCVIIENKLAEKK